MWSLKSCGEWVLPKWAWSGSREQFLDCGLRKFRHSKSSVYRWYPQLVRGRFVYDTYKTMEATRTRHGWAHMFVTHRPFVTLQHHNFDLFRTCRTSSFCTVARQLAKFQLTRRIARSIGDSWASYFASGIHKLVERWDKCLNKLGEYVEKWIHDTKTVYIWSLKQVKIYSYLFNLFIFTRNS